MNRHTELTIDQLIALIGRPYSEYPDNTYVDGAWAVVDRDSLRITGIKLDYLAADIAEYELADMVDGKIVTSDHDACCEFLVRKEGC